MKSFDHSDGGWRENRNGTEYKALPRVSSPRGVPTSSIITPAIRIGANVSVAATGGRAFTVLADAGSFSARTGAR